MARRNLNQYNASEFAAAELDYVLDQEQTVRAPSVPTIPVAEAVRGKQVFEIESDRTTTRVLFISQDELLLNPTSQTLDGFLELSQLFAEVHILVLRQGRSVTDQALRVSDTVWLYTATARHWWWTPMIGWRRVQEQLVFAGGLRPDLIVARDPFESALLGSWVSQRHGRPLQVHVRENFYTSQWRATNRHAWGRRWLAQYVLPRTRSVQVETENIHTQITKRFPQIASVQILPRYRNYAQLLTTPVTIDLKERFKPHIFFMAYIGALTHESTVYRAIDAARFVLQNPRVCLLVLGDGPARGEFERRAKIHGIDKQVIFATHVTDATAVLKSSNLLLVTDTNADSDELALKAAALGVPMIMAKTPLREDVFVDGESAFLVEPTDVQQLADRISDVLNNVPLRRQFGEAAQTMISERFHEDPITYSAKLRESIEHAILVDESDT